MEAVPASVGNGKIDVFEPQWASVCESDGQIMGVVSLHPFIRFCATALPVLAKHHSNIYIPMYRSAVYK